MRTFAIRCLSTVFILSLFASSAMAVPATGSKPAADNSSKASNTVKLHRADFRVTGASCVACLRRIGKTIREQKGVLKADVSIFKPYWAIAIYDAEQTNMDKIYDAIRGEKVKFEDLEDKPIQAVPLIIIPKGMSKAQELGLPATGGGAAGQH